MEQREDNRRHYAEAAAGLLDDLRAAGVEVKTLAELRRRRPDTKDVVPVLAKWLPKARYLPLKRDIIATMGSSWARPEASRPLLEEFHRLDPTLDKPGGMRWSIGDALERVADETVLDDLIAIATDRRYGRDRQLVVASLGNMVRAKERAVPVLLDLLDDEEVAPYAVMGLGKLRVHEARTAIQSFVDHPEAWVRSEAKKALARLSS
jgi:HEAT repeat protein